jgi:hypothetical protein
MTKADTFKRNSAAAFAYWKPYIVDFRKRGVTWPTIAEHIGQDCEPLKAWARVALDWHDRLTPRAARRVVAWAARKGAAENERRRQERERKRQQQAEQHRQAAAAKRREVERQRQEKAATRRAVGEARRAERERKLAAASNKTPDEKFAALLAASGGGCFEDAKVPRERRMNGAVDSSAFVPREANS